jgi:hypothetical protein
MKLLKQKGSGAIYVWTQFLAERSDMEPYEPQVPQLITPPEPEVVEPVAEPEPEPQLPTAAEMAQAVAFKRKRK